MKWKFLWMLAIIMATPAIGKSSSQEDRPLLKCQTPHQKKVFVIWPRQVVFITEDPLNFNHSRTTSSVGAVRTTPTPYGGFNKYLRHNGYSYRIHIRKLNGPNALYDYIALSNQKGHQVSYPITCQQLTR